jgi:hypothetical protein
MDIMIGFAFFGVGLGLIIFFAEQLVKGVVGTSMGVGLSPFLFSVIFIGFDPDNLAVGTAASAEAMAGIAPGSVLSGAMVAIALAFGMTVLAFLVSIEELERGCFRIHADEARAALGWKHLDPALCGLCCGRMVDVEYRGIQSAHPTRDKEWPVVAKTRVVRSRPCRRGTGLSSASCSSSMP